MEIDLRIGKSYSRIMKIFLDDLRDCPEGYALARDVATARKMLVDCAASGTIIEELSFDNDLGENQPEGRHLMDWLEEQHIVNGFPLPSRMRVHSANPVAASYMRNVIEALYGRQKTSI